MQNLPRLRVLVLEENPLLQKIVYNLATCSGMATQMVHGQKAFSVLQERETTIDLLVIGWDTLAADEFAAAAFLRQKDGTRIPVIVHLPDKDEDKMQQAAAMGIATVLPRIFSAQLLRETMRLAIEASTSARRAALEPHIPGLSKPSVSEQEAAAKEVAAHAEQPQIVYVTQVVEPEPPSQPAPPVSDQPPVAPAPAPAPALGSAPGPAPAVEPLEGDLESAVPLPDFTATTVPEPALAQEAPVPVAPPSPTAAPAPVTSPAQEAAQASTHTATQMSGQIPSQTTAFAPTQTPPPATTNEAPAPEPGSDPSPESTTPHSTAKFAMKWAEAPQEAESPGAKAKRLFADGRDALKAEEYERAASSFSKILAMRGRFPDACRGLAIAHQRLGNLSKFNHYMNMAAEGYVWKGTNTEAEKLFANLKKHHCQAINPYLTVADVLFQRGKGDVALALYEKAHQLEPHSLVTTLALGKACHSLGCREEALEHVTTILQHDDTIPGALALYAELAGKEWHITEQDAPPQEVWEVEELAICPALDESGPVLLLDGENSPLDVMAYETEPVDTAAQSPQSGIASQNAPHAPQREGAPTILIVDDEPHIRMLLEETLESLEDQGVTLLYAEDGEEGLEIIKEERPHLVFLDVMMPRMNGFEVCDWVKNKLALEGVYIIMLTAKGQEFDSQRGMEVGADVYMTKPFRPSEVLLMARTVLGIE